MQDSLSHRRLAFIAELSNVFEIILHFSIALDEHSLDVIQQGSVPVINIFPLVARSIGEWTEDSHEVQVDAHISKTSIFERSSEHQTRFVASKGELRVVGNPPCLFALCSKLVAFWSFVPDKVRHGYELKQVKRPLMFSINLGKFQGLPFAKRELTFLANL